MLHSRHCRQRCCFSSRPKKKPIQQDQRQQPWLNLARSRQTPPQYRDLVEVPMPCSGPQGSVPEPRLVFQTTLFPSPRGTSRAPVRLPSVLPSIASHRSGTTSSNPRFHGVYIVLAESSDVVRRPRIHVSNETASKIPKGRKTPHLPLKHQRKEVNKPFTRRRQTLSNYPLEMPCTTQSTTAVVRLHSLRPRHLGEISSTVQSRCFPAV